MLRSLKRRCWTAVATALAAALCICLAPGVARAFGVDFKTGDLSPGAVAFEADVMVSAARLERPLDSGLFLAWQSEIYASSDPSLKVGGHWGLQILTAPWAPGGAFLTLNFGWGMDRAILPLGLASSVRTASRPDGFLMNNSERMKAEIEHNIAANPKSPNLFLAYVGEQGGIAGTQWAETDYHVVGWQLNHWYRVRLARSPQPVEPTAWVLKRNAQGVYGFPAKPERVRAYRWQVTLTPLQPAGPGQFREAGAVISLTPFFVPEQFDSVRTFNCWGEGVGGTPRYPLKWCQARPRHVRADGSVVEVEAATAGFWGYDQPDNDAGPLDDSRQTHAFYIGYSGYVDVGGAGYPVMWRHVRSGCVLWDDTLKDVPAFKADSAPVEWNEAALSAYLAQLPGVRYASRRGQWQGRSVVVDRRASMPAGSGVTFSYAGMFGPGAEGVRFNVSANDDGWLAKDEAGFRVVPGAAGGKPFHAEVEAYAPGTSDTVAWIDLLLMPRS